MCEHSELIAEMPLLEKMSTQERLKLARKRRMQQLKKWSQREKDHGYKKKIMDNSRRQEKKSDYKVHFVPSVMLLEAAARNDIEEVRRLLMLGVSPDSTNEDGLTALHQCCIDDSEEMMKLLIDFGANINAKDSEKWTPLHAAATCGLLHLVKYLILKGADLLAVNADGNMPYDICEDETTLDYIESEMAKRGITQEMIDDIRASTEYEMLFDLKKLAEQGGDLEYRDAQGATPLHIAAANGYSSVVEFLLDNHVSTDVVDNDLWQPIHAAACWGHPDVLETLVQAGADLSAVTKSGETPLEICEDPELKERIVQLRSEMETKRSTHSLRLKRSHSQNTRSQSVRRTSIREKSQISRREALEEARLRTEKAQNGEEIDDEGKKLKNGNHIKGNEISSNSNRLSEMKLNGETTSSHLAPNDNLLVGTKSSTSISPFMNSSSLLSPSETVIDSENCQTQSSSSLSSSFKTKYQVRPSVSSSGSSCNDKDATVIKNEGYYERDSSTKVGENEFNNSVVDGLSCSGSLNDSTFSSQGSNKMNSRGSANSGESVKVDMNITVSANPSFDISTGTLSDLKKLRANLRHRNSQSSLESPTSVPVNSIDNLPLVNEHGYTLNNSSQLKTPTYLLEKPPSPIGSIKKFRADPSEVLGETQNKGCCKLM